MDIGTFSQNIARERTDLLQKSLRDPVIMPYKIDLEFPIVLSPQKCDFSFCATRVVSQKKQLLAHANYWPRSLFSSDLSKVVHRLALVGNVATSPDFRGRGLMRELFDFLWNLALSQNQDGLILWSDLGEFYHNLGFEPCGQEWRMRFCAKKMRSLQIVSDTYWLSNSSLSLEDLDHLVELRYPTENTLNRSAEEFKALLTIPDTDLFLWGENRVPAGYCIVGKGADLKGVIHEFGASSSLSLLHALKFICRNKAWSEVMLLGPKSIDQTWISHFNSYLIEKSVHPMAWLRERPNSGLKHRLAEGFIWGLDSI